MAVPMGVMYVPCAECARVRTVRVQLDRWHIDAAMRGRCISCAVSARHREALECVIEDVEWLGLSPELTAARLGTTVAALARRFYRAGRPDLARPFQRANTRAVA